MNILQAIADNRVFAGHFRGTSWIAWKVFLTALFALPMTPEQVPIYQRHTGRTTPPTRPSHEAWLCIGRRGGKSFILAVIAVFLACFTDWRPFLRPGEVATIMIIARDRKQARVIKRFITGLLHEVKMLKQVVEGETQESIQLKNRVSIEIHTASFRSTRGYTIVAALLDEIAYWETDETGAEPDIEVVNAIKPGMATIPGAMLLCASSPHARRGALWEIYRKHYGQDGDEVLVWQATTRDMNPSVPQSYIDKHIADDPARAAAEYGAVFRTDIEAFVACEVVEAAVVPGRRELPPMNGTSYIAYLNPSGGTSDSMTLAIAHRDRDGRAILDAVRERKPPFSPEAVVAEFATLLQAYGIRKLIGDRYGGEFVREPFRSHGCEYELADKPKSDVYRDLLPAFNSNKIELLDNQRIVTQFCSLERRVTRGGKDSISHVSGAHDDLANASAGALLLALNAVPALWRPESFVVNTSTAAMPIAVGLIFATVVVSDAGQAGVAYFTKSIIPGSLLTILDVDFAPLSPTLLQGMPMRLADFRKAMNARGVMTFAQTPVKAELERLGAANVEPLDYVLSDPLLNVAAAVHVSANHVQLCAEVLAKDYPLGFLHGAAADDDDSLSLAVLAGIVLALDEGRTLRKPRAA